MASFKIVLITAGSIVALGATNSFAVEPLLATVDSTLVITDGNVQKDNLTQAAAPTFRDTGTANVGSSVITFRPSERSRFTRNTNPDSTHRPEPKVLYSVPMLIGVGH